MDTGSVKPPSPRSTLRRVGLLLLVVYLASCAGAASVLLTSPVCTQYGMAGLIPAAPLVGLMGLFVVVALAVAGLRAGVLTAIIAILVLAGVSLALWYSMRAAWRGTRAGPILTVGMIVLSTIIVLLTATTGFAFCLSMSV